LVKQKSFSQVSESHTSQKIENTLMSAVLAWCTILHTSTRHLGAGGGGVTANVCPSGDNRLITRRPRPWCFSSTAISNLSANSVSTALW